MNNDHARNFSGYGPQPPHAGWPGSARVAINFVVNYEEGAEYCVLNGDDRPETILAEVAPAPPALGKRDLNMESLYEYGSRAGVWRVFRAFRERDITPTVYAVGLALQRNPQVAEAIAASGSDIVAHGWRWIDYAAVEEAQEREDISRCAEVIAAMTGRQPLG